MTSLVVDVFVEDRGHEELVVALVRRIAREQHRPIQVRVRAARGGHARVFKELDLYQRAVVSGVGAMTMPDVLVVATDTNCHGLLKTGQDVTQTLDPRFRNGLVIAAPDPHIERWYLAEAKAFKHVVGIQPPSERRKCERGRYKKLLADSVRKAGHPPGLGGIEFARELAEAMDFYGLAKAEPGFEQFFNDLTSALKLAPE